MEETPIMADPSANNCQRRGTGRPFSKGFDSRRNLDGRPKESRSLSDELRRIWDQPSSEAKPILEALGYDDFPDTDLTIGQVLAYRLVGDAWNGRMESFKQIGDRLDPITKKEEHVLQTVDPRASLISVFKLIEERKSKPEGKRLALAADYLARDRGEITIENGFVLDKPIPPLALIDARKGEPAGAERGS